MRVRTTLVVVAAALLVITATTAVFGAPSTPAITTPTPQPTPTTRPLTILERLALTPEAERQANLVLLPFISNRQTGLYSHVNPDSFTYTVQSGDTLWSLALNFGRDLDTMSCVTSPMGADAETLQQGQVIIVPAFDDVCYTVRAGESLAGIAARNKIAVPDIVDVAWNGFTSPPYRVQARQRVLLPNARPNAQPRPNHREISRPEDQYGGTVFEDWPYGDGKFVWPVEGWISQGARTGHTAIDIAVAEGTPIHAADRGTVVLAGWNPTGYGFRVVIDHGTDYVTLYAHLRDIYVEKGQVVGKGQIIGAAGANGNITGPHLHFEVRDFGRLIDPRKVLPEP
jgi:murein DD-endopeptidase MepM/ murein hydrolase activator NlpD